MGRTAKYATEEERKAANAAIQKAWREAHPEKQKEYEARRQTKKRMQRILNNPPLSQEEAEEKKRLAREHRAAYLAQWEEAHKEERRQYMREYARTHPRKKVRQNPPE